MISTRRGKRTTHASVEGVLSVVSTLSTHSILSIPTRILLVVPSIRASIYTCTNLLKVIYERVSLLSCAHAAVQEGRNVARLSLGDRAVPRSTYLRGTGVFDSIVVVPTKKRSGLETKSPEAVFTGTYVHH